MTARPALRVLSLGVGVQSTILLLLAIERPIPRFDIAISRRGQLLEVKDGIDQMLKQLDLPDEGCQTLEDDRDALAALAGRLANIPTPAEPTPQELGPHATFIPLTALRDSRPGGAS